MLLAKLTSDKVKSISWMVLDNASFKIFAFIVPSTPFGNVHKELQSKVL